ncbi:MAG TPA: phosphopantetheine-binding protein [Marmoricola sp.]|nr:phosphopantetheine-binding protein [Marmoricola sp.]
MNDPTPAHPTVAPEEARRAVLDAIRRIVPDADFDGVDDTTRLRTEFELDSLDFLSFVELLVEATGRPIGEGDYDSLQTLGSAVDFLAT